MKYKKLSDGVLNHPVRIHWKKCIHCFKTTAAKPLPAPTTNAIISNILLSGILLIIFFILSITDFIISMVFHAKITKKG
jgi:hypothetical protein